MRTAVQTLLSTIDAGYSNGESRLDEDLPLGERGDTLADFIAMEIREVCEGESDDNLEAVALAALENAVRQLQDAISAVERGAAC